MQNPGENNASDREEVIVDFSDLNAKLMAFNQHDADEFEQFFLEDDSIPIPYHIQPTTEPHYGQMLLPPSNEQGFAPTPGLSLDTGDEVIYRNKILGEFKSPVTPLSIIDNHKHPFDRKLQQLLEAELRKERNAEIKSKKQELRVSPYDGKMSKNKRPQNIAEFDAKDVYKPVPKDYIRYPWGADPRGGPPMFQYSEHGELTPGATYTTEELHTFLYDHKDHWRKEQGNRKQSGLRLWIQNHPADSKNRYPVPGKSEKCRWAECPVKGGTIHKGFFRVAFDEVSSWYPHPETLDPFHNAGYMHLSCLEKMLDFPLLCKHLDVVPDCRVLLEGHNRMAINRDHKKMEHICLDFIQNSQPGQKQNTDSDEWYKDTLSYRLTKYHITHQPNHIKGIRGERGGNNIDIHLGNTEVYARNELTKKRRAPGERKAPSGNGRGKRKRNDDQVFEDDDEEEFIPDANIFDGDLRSPSRRPTKRPRRRSSVYQ
ncbi:hypothetical protein M7I_6069 [Glarea lozoyensis 74030]|uniref:Uncharacterized protein n=1 Tax=Glarea lozoyensis (strain ATCC 74030 / MF5533) TaxID=1104152 RepID=H0ETK5_GLAL7|nr:hypothetical protein M7I_6069 [Glarea lozoyensis 74030]